MSPTSGPESFGVKERGKQVASKKGKLGTGRSLKLEYKDLNAFYSLDFNRNGTLEVKRGEESIHKVTDNQEGKEVPTTFAGAYGGPQLDIYLEDEDLRVTAEREMGKPNEDTFNARVIISEIE